MPASPTMPLYVEPLSGRERGAAKRESAGEILTLSAVEGEGTRALPMPLYVEPLCGRERGAAERESAGEILSGAKEL